MRRKPKVFCFFDRGRLPPGVTDEQYRRLLSQDKRHQAKKLRQAGRRAIDEQR